jgi:hypothetical protein
MGALRRFAETLYALIGALERFAEALWRLQPLPKTLITMAPG